MKKILQIFSIGFALTITISSPTSASLSGNCGQNCTYIIENGVLKISGSGNINSYDWGQSPWFNERGQIKSVTVSEGITNFPSSVLSGVGNVKKIDFPKTMQNIANSSIPNTVRDITIVSGISNLNAWMLASGSSGINIQCKGNLISCQNSTSNLKSVTTRYNVPMQVNYYKGYDEDGNWVEYSENGRAVYTDSNKLKILGIYDSNGIPTEIYQYDNGGNLITAYKNGVEIYRRKIYTPAEATAAVSKNKNTFSIKYR